MVGTALLPEHFYLSTALNFPFVSTSSNSRMLTGLCNRRSWPTPKYTVHKTSQGTYTSQVLVNNRSYSTDLAYISENLARENAAMRAFMVCRDFSVNGGLLARNGVVQGLPVSTATTAEGRGVGYGGHGGQYRGHGIL